MEAAKPRLHHNVLVIALANKLASIAWSVLYNGHNYEINSSDIVPANKLDVSFPFQRLTAPHQIWRNASGNFICARSISLYTQYAIKGVAL